MRLLLHYSRECFQLMKGGKVQIVSELSEAQLYQVETTQEELDRENVKLAMRLRTLLDEGIPLSEIPKRMLAMDDVHSPLTTFHYRNLHYL